MGYETTWFVDEVDKEFVCSICMMVVERPLESPCEHVFCTKCIVGWITLDNRCPVDRKALHLRNLSAPARLYRNLWGKLKVKCPLGTMGCDSVMPLESLDSHLKDCTYKPNMIVLCDKGCRLKMTRLEYQKSCSAHLSTFLTNKFEREVDSLKSQIEQLNCRIKRQNETMTRLFASTQNVQPTTALMISHNMSNSSDNPNIFEPLNANRFCWAFAQFTTLNAFCTLFRIEVLNIVDGQYIVIGLTPESHIDEIPGHRIGSIGYCNRGDLVVDNCVTVGLPRWTNGDIIECGIQFTNSSLNCSKFKTGEVYFTINQTHVSKKKMKMPLSGLFPTIRMGSFTSESVPRIEYLTHSHHP